MPDQLPNDVKLFLFQYINSIAEWEALLLIRAHKDIAWDAETIAQRLYICPGDAEKTLVQLALIGFLGVTTDSSPQTYQYHPKTAELERLVEKTAELYKCYLVPITHVIHSKSKIQKFADAFRIRKNQYGSPYIWILCNYGLFMCMVIISFLPA